MCEEPLALTSANVSAHTSTVEVHVSVCKCCLASKADMLTFVYYSPKGVSGTLASRRRGGGRRTHRGPKPPWIDGGRSVSG